MTNSSVVAQTKCDRNTEEERPLTLAGRAGCVGESKETYPEKTRLEIGL